MATMTEPRNNIRSLDAAMLRNLPEYNPGAVAVVGADMDVYFVNEQFRHYLGYTKDDLETTQLSFSGIMEGHQHDQLAYQLNIVKNNPSQRSSYVIYQLRTKAGNVMPFYVYISPFEPDHNPYGDLYFFLMLPDFSKWGMPFTSFDSKELFLEQFDSVEFGTFEWITGVRKMFWSKGLCRIAETDCSAQDLGIDQLLAMVHPGDRERVQQFVLEVLESHGSLETEFRIVTPRNNVKLLHALARVTRAADGAPVKIAGSVRDVTAQREIENDLKKKVEELNHTNRELEEFAYVASHDLQEPLRKITTFSERLSEKFKDVLTGEGEMYLRRMTVAAENMRALINDLLEFSRISKARQAFEQVDLNTVLQQVRSDLELVIEDTKTTLAIDKLPVVDAVPSHMKQLFVNVVGNAIKFHKPEVAPHVAISVTNLTDAEKLQHDLPLSVSYHKIAVTDNGIGFEDEYAQRIFQVFQRLHGKSEYPGTGIGLAICKKIMEYQKGDIYAENIPGQGARFTILIPVAKQ